MCVFTVCVKELVLVRAVVRVPGDALHPPLRDALVGGATCAHSNAIGQFNTHSRCGCIWTADENNVFETVTVGIKVRKANVILSYMLPYWSFLDVVCLSIYILTM